MPAATSSLTFLRELVYRRSAIVIEPGKEYLFEARLLPIARTEGLDTIDALVDRLRQRPDNALQVKVVEAMTTNETSFFRDIHPFETLKTAILPELLEARASAKTLRIWCAAASTGQEPYTIAMTIREHFPALASWSVQILATDLNETVLERARRGVFKQLEVNRGLPVPLLLKYFDKVAHGDWQIKPELRAMINFQPLNLLDRWPLFAAQDIVFMRNVLIYFDVPTKRQILRRVREHLRPDGALLLGGAETTINVDEGWEAARTKASVFYRPVSTTPKEKVANASR